METVLLPQESSETSFDQKEKRRESSTDEPPKARAIDHQDKEKDNHHSPMKPSQYISARLVPMLDYYRTQLPRKYMEWKATVFLILLVRPQGPAFFMRLQTEQS